MPIQYTDVGETPLFIGAPSMRLDLSQVFADDDKKFALAKDLSDRDAKTRQALRDLKLPEMTGNRNNVELHAGMARSARQNMVNAIANIKNVNAAMSDPAFLEAQAQWAMATDPATETLRKNRFKEYEAFNSQMAEKSKKGYDVSGNVVFDEEGLPVVDHADPSTFLKAGDLAYRAENSDEYTLDAPFGRVPLSNISLVVPNEVYSRWEDRIKTSASTTIGGDQSNASSLAGMMSSEQVDPMLKFALMWNRKSTRKTNREQIMAGFKSVLNGLDNSDINGIFQDYVRSPEFQKLSAKPISEGGFLNDDGSMNPEAARDRMIAGDGNTSFMMDQLGNVAQRFMDTSDISSTDYQVWRDKSKGSGADMDKVPESELLKNGPLPDLAYPDPKDPNKIFIKGATERMRKTTIGVPIPRGDGKIVQHRMEVPEIRPSNQFMEVLSERFAGKKLNAPMLPIEERLPADEVLRGSVIRMPNGNIISSNQLAGARVRKIGSHIQYTPDLYGRDLTDHALEGIKPTLDYDEEGNPRVMFPHASTPAGQQSSYTDMWIPIEIEVHEDNEVTDYAPGDVTGVGAFATTGKYGGREQVGGASAGGGGGGGWGPIMRSPIQNQERLGTVNSVLELVPLDDSRYEKTGAKVKIEDVEGTWGAGDMQVITVWARASDELMLEQKPLVDPAVFQQMFRPSTTSQSNDVNADIDRFVTP